ncbi:MAG: hypothetical protein SF029_12140 [bacterium]|nr:hypothetical protein [bacterium]
MPVLLLAHGDPQAKDLLKKAIEARYGVRPPALDSLKLDFKGRARAKVGPVMTWVPVDATAYFRFPSAMRWDFNVKPLGLSVQRGVEAYDGTSYRTVRGDKQPNVVHDDEQIASMRRRLWATAAILLTPLGDHFVKLSCETEKSFSATNTQLHDAALIALRPNRLLDSVQVDCHDPDGKPATFSLRLADDQIEINDFMLPSKISAYWDDQPTFELEPVMVSPNPDIPDAVFTLEA